MDLNSPVSEIPTIGSVLTKKLKRLGINTIQDLFYHIPSKYLDYSNIKNITDVQVGEIVTIHGTISYIKSLRTKRGLQMQMGQIQDETGKLTFVFFNQNYLMRTLYPGKYVSMSGKVSSFSGKACLSSPEFEILDTEERPTTHTGKLVPVYPETAGLSSKWLRTIVKKALNTNGLTIDDYIPKSYLKKENLVDFQTAIELVHTPSNISEVEKGKYRLAFNELLMLNLKSTARKVNWNKNKSPHKLKVSDDDIVEFLNLLPFKPTSSQLLAMNQIKADMQKTIPMNRLLEGDVGSGKTIVAAFGCFIAYKNGFQSVIMAPTQILAQQHYKTISNLFTSSKKNKTQANIKVQLITSETKQKEITKADIHIGTHALIHKNLDLSEVAFVVIDEQHRFGVEQREHLVKRSKSPHILTMTATPIPRTIALTTYADLDLSILDEMPTGRQKITTWVVPNEKRKGAYDWIEKELNKNKSQAFIVCPLIDESTSETMKDIKSVTQEFANLKLVFKKFKLGLLHGKLKREEKEQVLDDFRDKKIDILVATPVVEVGIDIPNATIMVIEAAERFGLAQLHQLRGRVGRGDKKSYCLLFSNIKYSKRLNAMTKTTSGIKLAELDLEIRGPGEIFGTKQSGFPELKVASWNNLELIQKTKTLAEEIFSNTNKIKPFTNLLKILQ